MMGCDRLHSTQLKHDLPKIRLTLYIPDAMLQCVNDLSAELQQSRLKTIDHMLRYAIRQMDEQEILLEDYPKAQYQYCSILCDAGSYQALQRLSWKYELKRTEVANRLIWYSLNYLPEEIICANYTNHRAKTLSELK